MRGKRKEERGVGVMLDAWCVASIEYCVAQRSTKLHPVLASQNMLCLAQWSLTDATSQTLS